jgi:hypothetical protein
MLIRRLATMRIAPAIEAIEILTGMRCAEDPRWSVMPFGIIQFDCARKVVVLGARSRNLEVAEIESAAPLRSPGRP